LPLVPIPPTAFDFILQVERFYTGLMRHAAAREDAGEPNLGGRLVWVGELGVGEPGMGELGGVGRSLMVASNIAGAASLAATADVEAQRQSIRDGVADFMVTNLDEALRILKNEVRKRNAVAVCVAADAAAREREMLERGVVPDLVFAGGDACERAQLSFGGDTQGIQISPSEEHSSLLMWSIEDSPALWMPKLDAVVLGCLPPSMVRERRWLRVAPRYLGRLGRGVRALCCETGIAKECVERIAETVKSGEIGVGVRVTLNGREDSFVRRLGPGD
jgi:urocanase-like protein